jgi:hypothetical protein
MSAVSTLDAATVRAWIGRAVDDLGVVRAELDRVNVFPVADADTGTNLYATLCVASRWIQDSGDHAGDTLAAVASGALAGARGNSGTILGAYLRGLADGAQTKLLKAAGLAAALDTAARSAARAVDIPVDGTVLTAARGAADAALIAAGRPAADLAAVVCGARDGAREAAARSGFDLPELARRGVLDAGALGLVVLLDALATVVTGEDAGPLPGVSVAPGTISLMPPEPMDREFEVVFTVDADDDAAAVLRSGLSAAGTSVVMADGAAGAVRRRRVHVHADDPVAVVHLAHEAAVRSEGTVHGMQVQALGPAPAARIVTVTTAPALLADIARAGASAYLDLGGWIEATPPGPGEPIIVVTARKFEADEQAALIGALETTGAPVDIVEATADVQVIAALTAVLSAGDAPVQALAARMRAAVHASTVIRAQAATLPPVPPGAIMTVLADCDADQVALAKWAEAATADGADIVLWASGRPGPGIEIGLENPL